eukprot:gene2206-5217_t
MDDNISLFEHVLHLAEHGPMNELVNMLTSRSHVELSQLLSTADSCGRTAIHLACFYGHVDMVSFLLSIAPGLLTIPDGDELRRATPIHYACWGGSIQVVKILVAKGATIYDTDTVQNTPFLYAVFGGNLKVVQYLLNEGALLKDINQKGHSAIIQAACGGHQHIVEFLLHRGASLQERDHAGNTPLLFAAWGGHLSLVQWLLTRGSSLDEVSNSGHSALLSAVNSGATDVVAWLVDVCGVDISARNANRDSCVLLAAFGGHLDLFKWLIRRGSSLLERNEDGLDPLLSACNGGHLDMVRYLISCGCSTNVTNDTGYTPLILAACGGHCDLVQWLVENQDCDIHAKTADGDTALLLACYCGHVSTVEWLLQNGASLTERNHAGLTPLISAANGGHADVMEHLLEKGASVDEFDNEGYTALLLAARRGHLNCVQMLMMFGANARTRINQGLDAVALSFEHDLTRHWIAATQELTPLHIAVLLDSERHVKRLLRAGHAPDCLTWRNTGPSPLDLASFDRTFSPTTSPSAVINIRHILKCATQPWLPQTHFLFGARTRRLVILTLMLARKLYEERPDLPGLPEEVWFHIIAMLGRDPKDHEEVTSGNPICFFDMSDRVVPVKSTVQFANLFAHRASHLQLQPAVKVSSHQSKPLCARNQRVQALQSQQVSITHSRSAPDLSASEEARLVQAGVPPRIGSGTFVFPVSQSFDQPTRDGRRVRVSQV